MSSDAAEAPRSPTGRTLSPKGKKDGEEGNFLLERYGSPLWGDIDLFRDTHRGKEEGKEAYPSMRQSFSTADTYRSLRSKLEDSYKSDRSSPKQHFPGDSSKEPDSSKDAFERFEKSFFSDGNGRVRGNRKEDHADDKQYPKPNARDDGTTTSGSPHAGIDMSGFFTATSPNLYARSDFPVHDGNDLPELRPTLSPRLKSLEGNSHARMRAYSPPMRTKDNGIAQNHKLMDLKMKEIESELLKSIPSLKEAKTRSIVEYSPEGNLTSSTSFMDRNLDRRLNEMERQTELLGDRTKFLVDTTEDFKKTLEDESALREDSIKDLSQVRFTIQEKIEQELDQFWFLANEKMQELIGAQETIHELEKRFQKKADAEMKTAMGFVKDRAESNDRWGAGIKEELSNQFRDMSNKLNDKICDSIAQVGDHALDLSQMMESNFSEQENVNNQNIAHHKEMDLQIRKIHVDQVTSVESLKNFISEIREDQKTIESRTEDRLRACGEKVPQMHENTMQRVDEAQIEWLGNLCKVEDVFQTEQKAAINASERLKGEVQTQFSQLKQNLQDKKNQLDSIRGLVAHNQSVFKDDAAAIRLEMERKLAGLSKDWASATAETTEALDHRLQHARDELASQKSTQNQFLADVDGLMADLKILLQKREMDTEKHKQENYTEQMMLQDEIRELRESLLKESAYEADTISAIREQFQGQRLLINDILATMEGKNRALSTRMDTIDVTLTREQTARAMEFEQLERGITEYVTTVDEFGTFKNQMAEKDQRTESTMDIILKGLEDVHSRIEKTVEKLTEMKQSAKLSKEDLAEFRHASSLKAADLQAMRDGLVRLENKLLTNPALERVLLPANSPQQAKRRSQLAAQALTSGPRGPPKNNPSTVVGNSAANVNHSSPKNDPASPRSASMGADLENGMDE